jgi:hypothetical protein
VRYAFGVALPETIPVKYTEEEAEYLSVRPVVRQTFRLDELLDMLLTLAGKDVARLRQILRAGTAVYHSYRYWWPGFDAAEEDLRAALARFPEPDPGRPFRSAECAAVLLEVESGPGRAPLELPREAASRRRWFRRASLWDALMGLAESAPPEYVTYSYAHRGDLYAARISAEQRERLAREGARLVPGELARHARGLAAATRILFLCPRK